jgi:hypothetical protein
MPASSLRKEFLMVGNRTWLAAAVVAMLVVAAGARAQDVATSFDQLRVLVKPADTVTVTDAMGHQIRGRLRSLSSSSLELSVGNLPRLFSESEVRGVSQHRHASFGTGAKWGFIVGAGLGVLGGASVASEGYSGSEAVGWVLGGAAMYHGLGAGIGVGVATLIRGPHPVYAGRPTPSSRVAVSPLLSASRKGVSVSLGF